MAAWSCVCFYASLTCYVLYHVTAVTICSRYIFYVSNSQRTVGVKCLFFSASLLARLQRSFFHFSTSFLIFRVATARSFTGVALFSSSQLTWSKTGVDLPEPFTS